MPPQAPSPPPKEDVARTLLLRGSLFVYLDPRQESVQVPPWLANQAQLVLQVGLDLPIPIPDLRVDDEGVFGTLSFNRSPFTCRVPWSAVFGLVGDDGMGYVWNEDLPEEIAAEVEATMRRARKGPALRPIEGGAGRSGKAPSGKASSGDAQRDDAQRDDAQRDDAQRDDDARAGEARPERPRGKAPHLRLVKS